MTASSKNFWNIRKQKSQAKLRLATINAKTLVGRSAEVTKLEKRVDVVA